MTPAGGGPSRVALPRLRAAVIARVELTSLRRVASEIGMSAPGLQSFLDGGTPFEATRRKLSAWYFARASGGESRLTAAIAENYLTALLSHLPERRRDHVLRVLLRTMASLTRREKVEPPDWLVELRAAKRSTKG
jgi:hypothetical protein